MLSLSVVLIKGHEWGTLPKLLCFAAFASLLSLVTALLFAASTWREFLRPWVRAASDGGVLLLNLVAGIVSFSSHWAFGTDYGAGRIGLENSLTNIASFFSYSQHSFTTATAMLCTHRL